MTIYEWLTLLGAPMIILAAFKLMHSHINKNKQDIKCVKLGIQALLRSQMIADYNRYQELGYAPIYARENFENCWKQYHALGANGVMDDLHAKFLLFPTEKRSNAQ